MVTYEKLRSQIENELCIDLEQGDLVSISFPFVDKDKVLVSIFGTDGDSLEYSYSLSAETFLWKKTVADDDILDEVDTEIELRGKVVRRNHTRVKKFVPTRISAVAGGGESDDVREHVEKSVRTIHKLSSDWGIVPVASPPFSEADESRYVAIMQALGYKLRERDAGYHVWRWKSY